LVVDPKLATIIGLKEAMILHQIDYWLQRSTNLKKGKIWVYNTVDDWVKQFPFMSRSTVRRTIESLKKKD